MTEQRIREMDRQEVLFRAYGMARGDMDHTFSFSEEETMEMTLTADIDELKAYMVENIEFVDDDDIVFYKDYEIVRDVLEGYGNDLDGTVEYGVHEDVGKDSERYLWFYTFAEAIDYINEEVA